LFFSIRNNGKTKTKTIIGENSPNYAYSWIPISKHAEIDALLKLKDIFSTGKRRRPIKMDLLVVRISKTGKLNNACPCYHCMRQLIQATFVNIKHLYYSTCDGSIVCRKFFDMVVSPPMFISSGYRVRMGLSEKTTSRTIQGTQPHIVEPCT
jgi:hypothetical protein